MRFSQSKSFFLLCLVQVVRVTTVNLIFFIYYRYYDQDLSLAKDLQDKMNMGRAYCNLGLAHLALGNLETALECQKYFLAIAHMTQHLQGKFRALGNIGDVLIKMGDIEEAVKMYQRQLGFARQVSVVTKESFQMRYTCNNI